MWRELQGEQLRNKMEETKDTQHNRTGNITCIIFL